MSINIASFGVSIEFGIVKICLMFIIFMIVCKKIIFYLAENEIGFNLLEWIFNKCSTRFIFNFIFITKLFNLRFLLNYIFSNLWLPIYIKRAYIYRLNPAYFTIFNFIFILLPEWVYEFILFIIIPFENMYYSLYNIKNKSIFETVELVLTSLLIAFIWLFILKIEFARIIIIYFLVLGSMIIKLIIYQLEFVYKEFKMLNTSKKFLFINLVPDVSSLRACAAEFYLVEADYFENCYLRKFLLTRILNNKILYTRLEKYTLDNTIFNYYFGQNYTSGEYNLVKLNDFYLKCSFEDISELGMFLKGYKFLFYYIYIEGFNEYGYDDTFIWNNVTNLKILLYFKTFPKRLGIDVIPFTWSEDNDSVKSFKKWLDNNQ